MPEEDIKPENQSSVDWENPKDVSFLSNMKAQGVSAPDAFQRLSDVKRKTESPIASSIRQLREAGKSEEDINTIISSSATVPDVKGGLQKGIEGVQEGFKGVTLDPEERETPAQQAIGAFADPFIGAAKGALGTAKGAGELGEKGLRALTPEFGLDPERPTAAEKLIPEELTESKGGFQKAGEFVEGVGEFALPLGAAKQYTVGASLFRRAVAEGVISAGVASVKSGEVGKDTAISGALGFGMPLIGAAGKGLLTKLFGTKALANAAVGLPPSIVSRADKIVQSGIKVGGKATKAYDSFDDFLVKEGFFKNGLKTTRADMMKHAEELFKAASGSKENVLKGIVTKIPVKQIDNLQPLLKKMLKAYDDDLTRTQFHRVNRFVQGIKKGTIKKLSATELDEIRFLADDILPRGAFSGAEPAKVKGLEEAIKPLRSFIAGLDKTGQIQHDNIVKRVIGEMLGFSSKNNPMAMAVDKSGVGTMVRDMVGGVGAGLGATIIPGAQPLAPFLAAGGLAKVIADQPQVASALVNQMTKITGNTVASQLIKQLPLMIESAILEGSTEATD